MTKQSLFMSTDMTTLLFFFYNYGIFYFCFFVIIAYTLMIDIANVVIGQVFIQNKKVELAKLFILDYKKIFGPIFFVRHLGFNLL